jgi:hypothetical protein
MSDAADSAPTRRDILRRAFALAAAGSTGGALTAAAGAGIAGAAPMTNSALLVPVVFTEMLGAFVYQQVLDAGVFTPHIERATQGILDQEQMHITTLSAELVRLGGTPPEPFSKVSDADKVLIAHRIPGGLGPLRNEHDCIILLARIEWLLEGAHYAAISKLQSAKALRLCSQVLANEAQHGTLLSELLHPGDVNKAVPSPFVRGTR